MQHIKAKNEAQITGHMRLEVRDSRTGELKRVHEQKNKIMASSGYGVNLIMRHFGGDDAFSIDLSKAKIGTGNTPVTAADTDLQTPTALNLSGSALDRSNKAVSVSSIELDFFLSDADLPNGTYYEFGIFTADERIFTRVLIGAPTGFSKATNEDAIVKYTITITPA